MRYANIACTHWLCTCRYPSESAITSAYWLITSARTWSTIEVPRASYLKNGRSELYLFVCAFARRAMKLRPTFTQTSCKRAILTTGLSSSGSPCFAQFLFSTNSPTQFSVANSAFTVCTSIFPCAYAISGMFSGRMGCESIIRSTDEKCR